MLIAVTRHGQTRIHQRRPPLSAVFELCQSRPRFSPNYHYLVYFVTVTTARLSWYGDGRWFGHSASLAAGAICVTDFCNRQGESSRSGKSRPLE